MERLTRRADAAGRRSGRRAAPGLALTAALLTLAALQAPLPSRAEAQDASGTAMDMARESSLDRYATLKRLSLDLTGAPPTLEQYEALDGLPDVPEEAIDAMLASEEFLEGMRTYHRDLLWANVSNIQYIQFQWDLTRVAVGPPNDRHTVHYLRRKGVYYRGGLGDDENDAIPCHNRPATFDAQGRIEVECDRETGRCLEGWVWVEPFWAPETEIKVCAFDAQEAERSESGGVGCGTMASQRETTCGCGPNMRYCDFRGDGIDVQLQVGLALGEQMIKLIEWVIEGDKPYHEILTTRMSFINGPLVHYYKHQMALATNVNLDPAPVDPVFLPDLAWTDDQTWLPVLQGEEHSGILTSYAFLLRFQTNRGRVNRFYNAFLDSHFDAAQGTDSPDCKTDSADLTKVCGCQKCHNAVEPWAAHWARWRQQGGGYLAESAFPIYDEVCEDCARSGIGTCPAYCRNEYVVSIVPADREPYLGVLRGYEFLGEQHQINATYGPRLWVERSIQDGSLASATVSKMWQHLMRRPLTASKADTDARLDLTRRFVQSDYNIKALVKAIVTHPAYRRIR